MAAHPWIIRQSAAILPPGYSLVGFWDQATETPYTLVYCAATRTWVGKGRRYRSEREAMQAAMRSARMVRYHQMCRSAA